VPEEEDGQALTLRAAAEVFVPGPPDDPTAGAVEVRAELFISHYLEFILPGLAGAIPELLDRLAADHHEGRAFKDLTLEDREHVLDLMSNHEIEDLREIPSLLAFLTIAAIYGEWSGQDAEGNLIRPPIGWRYTGFEGPSRGRPGLLHEK
jgi:gluconate 2-dehydrogenase subunit 3-like protein